MLSTHYRSSCRNRTTLVQYPTTKITFVGPSHNAKPHMPSKPYCRWSWSLWPEALMGIPCSKLTIVPLLFSNSSSTLGFPPLTCWGSKSSIVEMAFVLGFCPKLCWQLGKEELSYVDASYAGIVQELKKKKKLSQSRSSPIFESNPWERWLTIRMRPDLQLGKLTSHCDRVV